MWFVNPWLEEQSESNGRTEEDCIDKVDQEPGVELEVTKSSNRPQPRWQGGMSLS